MKKKIVKPHALISKCLTSFTACPIKSFTVKITFMKKLPLRHIVEYWRRIFSSLFVYKVAVVKFFGCNGFSILSFQWCPTDPTILGKEKIDYCYSGGLVASLIRFKCTNPFCDDLTLVFEDAQCFNWIWDLSSEKWWTRFLVNVLASITLDLESFNLPLTFDWFYRIMPLFVYNLYGLS